MRVQYIAVKFKHGDHVTKDGSAVPYPTFTVASSSITTAKQCQCTQEHTEPVREHVATVDGETSPQNLIRATLTPKQVVC